MCKGKEKYRVTKKLLILNKHYMTYYYRGKVPNKNEREVHKTLN